MKQYRYKPDVLRQMRKDAHISQADAARSTGLSPQQISAYEAGRCAPPLLAYAALVDCYGVPFDGALSAIAEPMRDEDVSAA